MTVPVDTVNKNKMSSAMLTHALKQPLVRAIVGPLAVWIHQTSWLQKRSQRFSDVQEPEQLTIQIPSSPTPSSEASSSPKELPPTLEEIAQPDFGMPVDAHEALVTTFRPVPKAPRKVWPAWARAHGLGNDQVFRLKHKSGYVYLRGVWEGNNYFLTSPRIAPIPVGREAEAEKNGWGVPIKWDSPTHAVALVKMSLGVALESGRQRRPQAQAYELEYLRGAHVWQRVYK
jgi:hypothetical protein